jgi:hypothetical protein
MPYPSVGRLLVARIDPKLDRQSGMRDQRVLDGGWEQVGSAFTARRRGLERWLISYICHPDLARLPKINTLTVN